jgi:hypothetical protein
MAFALRPQLPRPRRQGLKLRLQGRPLGGGSFLQRRFEQEFLGTLLGFAHGISRSGGFYPISAPFRSQNDHQHQQTLYSTRTTHQH